MDSLTIQVVGLTPRSKISQQSYIRAQRFFKQEKYFESITELVDSRKRITDFNKSKSGQYTIRDYMMLYSWNLFLLRKYEECLFAFKLSMEQGIIKQDDFECSLIRMWISLKRGDVDLVRIETDDLLNDMNEVLNRDLAELLFLRAAMFQKLGKATDAIDACESAHVLFKLLGHRKMEATLCNYYGNLLQCESRFHEAIGWYRRSLAANRRLGLFQRQGENSHSMGIAFYKCGSLNSSLKHLKDGLGIFEQHGSPDSQCVAYLALGHVHRLRGEFSEANHHLMEAHVLAKKQKLARETVLAMEFIGDVLRDQEKPEEALGYYNRAMEKAMPMAPEGDLVLELKRRQGECYEMLDKVPEAMNLLAEARAHARRLGDRFEEGIALRCLAVTMARICDWKMAMDLARRSIAMLDDIGARYDLAVTRLHVARIILARADDDRETALPGVLMEDAWTHAVAAQHYFLEADIDALLLETKQLLSQITRRRVAAVRHLQNDYREPVVLANGAKIVAVSTGMRSSLQLCEAYAGYNEPALIIGETGTGKELVAQRIHELSDRRAEPLVAVNVAAIPDTMFEREFFGHTRGAFSGAEQDRGGYVSEAEGGTLFLDEIADMPQEQQPKLLRLIQEGTYTALGDPNERTANVRLIAATNANLAQLAHEGKFRQDLYYRLRVLELDVPPLRERTDDIIPLLNFFLAKAADRKVTAEDYFDDHSIQKMLKFAWPGNVREIAVVAKRAAISLQSTGRVRVDLGLGSESMVLTGPEKALEASAGDASHENITRSKILVMLDDAAGNRAEVARQLKVSRPTLYRWLKKLDID